MILALVDGGFLAPDSVQGNEPANLREE